MIICIFTCPKKPDMKRHLLSVLPFILIPVLLSAQPKINFNKVTGVSDAEIYDAKIGSGIYAPLFDCTTWKPRRAYYTYVMFNELRKLGKAVALPKVEDGIYLCGATDQQGKAALMVSNISGKPWVPDFRFGKYVVRETYLLDETHLNEKLDRVPSSLDNWSVCLLLLERKE